MKGLAPGIITASWEATFYLKIPVMKSLNQGSDKGSEDNAPEGGPTESSI